MPSNTQAVSAELWAWLTEYDGSDCAKLTAALREFEVDVPAHTLTLSEEDLKKICGKAGFRSNGNKQTAFCAAVGKLRSVLPLPAHRAASLLV